MTDDEAMALLNEFERDDNPTTRKLTAQAIAQAIKNLELDVNSRKVREKMADLLERGFF